MDERVTQELVALLPRLRRFARGLTGSTEDADDLVQATCERAIARIHQWQPGTRLDSWMYRIVQTLHIDRHRAENTRRGHLELVASAIERTTHGEAVAEARITLNEVRRSVKNLPEEQRSVLLLVCVEGHSYKETAEVLGIPTGTVMSRLARARRAVIESFDDAASPRRTAANMRGDRNETR